MKHRHIGKVNLNDPDLHHRGVRAHHSAGPENLKKSGVRHVRGANDHDVHKNEKAVLATSPTAPTKETCPAQAEPVRRMWRHIFSCGRKGSKESLNRLR